MNVKFRFRSKSSEKVFNASQVCITGQSVFYNIVLSHGDGTIKNYPNFENDLRRNDPIIGNLPFAFADTLIYLRLFIFFHLGQGSMSKIGDPPKFEYGPYYMGNSHSL